jgi:hypothetical protein
MGFAVFCTIPVYDNRDGYVGARIERVSQYVYETEALAHRFVPSSYDEEGQPMDVDYFVACTSNPFKRLYRNVVADGFVDVYADDIPF